MRHALFLLALAGLPPIGAAAQKPTAATASVVASSGIPETDPHFYLQRAAAELKAKDYAAAEKDATKAMDMGYRKSSAFDTRAAARTGLGRFKEAFADADLAVSVNPGGAAGYLDRAAAREGMGSSPADILADFQKAAELDKRWKPVYEDAQKRYGAREAKPSAQPAAPSPKPAVVKSAPHATPAVSVPVDRSWRIVAIAAAAVVLMIALIIAGLRQHRTRRVRFGSVMSVPLPPGDEPSIGAVLGGRYILGKPAGQEDAADLFEARDLEDRPRALKRLRRTDTAVLQRAKAAGSLQHAAILAVEAVFDHAGHIYLACEPAAGEPLRQMVGRLPERRLAPDGAIGILQAAAAALDFAQGRGIRHAHLTPAHILVDRSKVQLKGFGLPPEASESDYLAPEQETGNAAAEADVFSLGVCLYEMLTGVRPYTGPEAGQNKREGRFTPASKLVPTLGEGLDELLARALDPDPARRFHAAGELFAAFRNLVVPGVH